MLETAAVSAAAIDFLAVIAIAATLLFAAPIAGQKAGVRVLGVPLRQEATAPAQVLKPHHLLIASRQNARSPPRLPNQGWQPRASSVRTAHNGTAHKGTARNGTAYDAAARAAAAGRGEN